MNIFLQLLQMCSGFCSFFDQVKQERHRYGPWELEGLGGIISSTPNLFASVCSSCSTILDGNPYSFLFLSRGQRSRAEDALELIVFVASACGIKIKFFVPSGHASTLMIAFHENGKVLRMSPDHPFRLRREGGSGLRD